MEGGLVKTLHPLIHGGLLAERNNKAHEEFLKNGVYFDVVVNNLYPFQEVIAGGTSPEGARINIDVGGPTITIASAKNWHSVAVLTNPEQYDPFIELVKEQKGTSLEQRFELAQKALKVIGEYRSAISNYFNSIDFEQATNDINIRKNSKATQYLK